MWTFWIDRGGTFTDIVSIDPEGETRVVKTPSRQTTGADPVIAAIRILMGVTDCEPFPAGRIASIRIGTTVATNALLERKGARTLLVTTEGFADALAIGDQTRPISSRSISRRGRYFMSELSRRTSGCRPTARSFVHSIGPGWPTR